MYGDDDLPSATDGNDNQQSQEEVITPLMNALAQYRDKVKDKAKEGLGPIMQISDQLRDDVLPHMGIKLEDKKPGEPASWMFVDKDVLLKEMEAKQAEKLAKEAAKKAKAELELKKLSTPGKDYFRVLEADKWKGFDEETGFPTLNAKGKPTSEQQINGFKKQAAKQEEKYQKWLAQQQATQQQEEKKE